MKREIIRTDDGSTTIHLPEWGESYHSKFGAIQEAYHVFIQNGLEFFGNRPASILEIGFGTGLNALITFAEAERKNQEIDYTGIEAYPVSREEADAMNYPAQLAIPELAFKEMHLCPWEAVFSISGDFRLTKRKQFFDQVDEVGKYHLIYFDAFGYQFQPELWSADIFHKMFAALKPGGILVTYAARSIIKRNMMAAGFSVEKLAGPPGKREMFRAVKLSSIAAGSV